MIERLVRLSLQQRLLVVIIAVVLFIAGLLATKRLSVDAFPDGASPYGILDMAGNQWEWVSSVYKPYPYRSEDGRESQSTGPIRSTRGGGHDSSAQELSTTQRGRFLSRNPKAGHHNIGFRCALTYRAR